MRIHRLVVAMAFGAQIVSAQEDTTRIETVSVAPGLFMLVGRGGNIGVSAGEDGVFLVDDQYAPLSGRIVEAVRKLSPRRSVSSSIPIGMGTIPEGTRTSARKAWSSSPTTTSANG